MNEDQDRIEGLDRLARSRAPSRDLWPGIAGRLRPRRRPFYPMAQFALAASLVAGLAAVFSLSLRPQGPSGTLDRVVMPLSHDSRAIVEANLSMVRQAERQLRQALKQDPNSPTLRTLLASTETRQRELTAML